MYKRQIYSISSAENFALGGIKILNEIGNIDYLVFGIEEDNLQELQAIADVLVNENDEFKRTIKEELDKGNSYPKAREIALKKVLSSENVEDIMQKPNNILAIEYLKALKITNSRIKPFAIKRKNSMHYDKNINKNYASGTYIRKLFIENNFDEISKVVPKYTYEKLLDVYKRQVYKLEESKKKGYALIKSQMFEKIVNPDNIETRIIEYIRESIKEKSFSKEDYLIHKGFINMIFDKEFVEIIQSRYLNQISNNEKEIRYQIPDLTKFRIEDCTKEKNAIDVFDKLHNLSLIHI